jgi:hypothetical protein
MLGEIGSFFARLMVPIDFQEGAESRIDAADPEALYAAFLLHSANRLRPGSPLRDQHPAFAASVDHERHRLERNAPAVWAAGTVLLDELEMGS